jgi:Fe-S-cluster containining protein
VSTSASTQVLERADPLADPLTLFQSLHRAFFECSAENHVDPIDAMSREAFDQFTQTSEIACENAPALACRGGCASCCTIRVVATAPEILSIARYIRSSSKTMEFELRRRIERCNDLTHSLDEAQRMEQGVACPFVDRDLCAVYSVRPLACRGHASYDVQACKNALAGLSCDVPISVEHLTVRSLVQNALQSALRDRGYAWGLYELNQALQIALDDDDSEAAWMLGSDIFVPAQISDVSSEEMAATFDAIKSCKG